MKLPLDIAESRLVTRGALLKTEVSFNTGETKEKYLVVVSIDKNADPLLLVLTTSKLRWYDENPDAPVVRLDVGEIPAFTKETIINCRELLRIPRNDLKRLYEAETLFYIDQLGDDILAHLDKALISARTLTVTEKQAVVPGYIPKVRPR